MKLTEKCHFNGLFIHHSGDVFPCCQLWNYPDKKIGHIKDTDIVSKIYNFDMTCECLIKIFKKTDVTEFNLINIEFDLRCNAGCAMCCVHAPAWKGAYTLFNELDAIVDALNPKMLVVQGGEVLVQKDTMGWILEKKIRNKELKFHIVTNGNTSKAMVNYVRKVFDAMTISIVGFQDKTYKTIMDLDVDKVKNFACEVIQKTNVAVSLKFLVTPLNIHEMSAFLDWATHVKPDSIQFVSASSLSDVKFGQSIPFWEVIFLRSGLSLKKSIMRNAEMLNTNNTKITFFSMPLDSLGIDETFITEHLKFSELGGFKS